MAVIGERKRGEYKDSIPQSDYWKEWMLADTAVFKMLQVCEEEITKDTTR